MKTKFLIAIVILLSISLKSNAQCKFKTNESDPFTSEKHLVTKSIRLNGDMKSANESKFLAITTLELTGSAVRWNFEYYDRSLRDNKAGKPIKLRLKTSSSVIEIITTDIPDPKFTITDNSEMTEFIFHFDLTIDQLKAMSKGLELVGMEIFNENKLFKTNSLPDVVEYAKCMTENK
jgi:hypothetical protein